MYYSGMSGRPTSEVARAVALVQQGMTVAQAAKKAGVAESSIRRMLHRMGAPLPFKN